MRRGLCIGALAIAAAAAVLWIAGVPIGSAVPAAVGGLERAAETVLYEVGVVRRPAPRAPLAAVADAPSSYRVRVVRAGGALVPGVAVLARSGHVTGADLEGAMRGATTVHSDADGLVRVDLAGHAATFFARHEGRAGVVRVERSRAAAIATLALHPDRALVLRVLEHDGTPASGVALHVSYPVNDTDFDGSPVREREYELGATVADGVLAWPDFGLLLAGCERRGLPLRSLRVRAALPAHAGVVHETEGLPPHGATIELRLPATGRVTVRLAEALAGGARVVELRQSWLDPESGEPQSRWSCAASARDGVAHFAHVPLDAILEARVRFAPDSPATLFPGPTAAAPDVEVALSLPDDLVLVRGRAVDERGRPQPGVRLRIAREHGARVSLWAETDPHGRFVLVVPSGLTGSAIAGARASVFPLPASGDAADIAGWLPLRAGVNDVGDVVLRARPLLVAGRVIAAPNAPCTNYSLAIERREPGGEWQPLEAPVTIDGERFAVRALPGPGEHRLRVVPAARCHIPPEPVPFAPGQADLAIALERGHTLAVRVRGLGDQDPLWLDLTLRATAGAAAARIAADRDSVPRSGAGETLLGTRELYWNGLVEGVYALEARLPGVSAPLRSVSGIRVPGPGGALARAELNVRGALREITVRARAPDGSEPIFDLHLLVAGRIVQRALTGRDGRAWRCRVVPGAFDAWLLAPGFAPALLRALDGDRGVELAPSGATLTVRIEGLAPLPDGIGARAVATALAPLPPGWQTIDAGAWTGPASMSPIAYLERAWPARVAAAVDDRGTARLVLARAGPQRLAVELFPRDAAARTRAAAAAAPLPGVVPDRIELAPGSAGEVAVRVPPGAAALALRALGGR